MYQDFTVTSSPETGAARLTLLRKVMADEGVDGFLIPRADAHFGENVAPSSERLAWLTGFTGSAGFCAALQDEAGVFIDGRYTLQVRSQIDLNYFTPSPIPETKLSDWLIENLAKGGTIAYDPWLHSFDEITKLEEKLGANNIKLVQSKNLIDAIWHDRPAPPIGQIVAHAIEFSGETSQSKRTKIAERIKGEGLDAFVLALPDSIAWLLNIRGSDVERTPIALAFAIIYADSKVDLITDPAKTSPELMEHLGDDIRICPPAEFGEILAALGGKIGVDRQNTPIWITSRLGNPVSREDHARYNKNHPEGHEHREPVWLDDPCILPKARKNSTEIAGTKVAHIRDGAAMAEFLCWLDADAPTGTLTEIDVVTKLEGFRRKTNALMDISFETISGAGPNGAIVHYRVDENSDRAVKSGDILLVDSGGQYVDGTTDITRTVAVGPVNPEAARANTLVLKGMIAISRARWPVGLAGCHLDSFARNALWQAGMDYDHGTGHGVGSYLSVHEGPQRISSVSKTPLEAGMILSNEPGYYKEGAYGIRIENLLVVTEPSIPNEGDRPMMGFETLTFVPIDKNLIVPDLLDQAELDWLNAYHAEVLAKLKDLVSDATCIWLKNACSPVEKT